MYAIHSAPTTKERERENARGGMEQNEQGRKPYDITAAPMR